MASTKKPPSIKAAHQSASSVTGTPGLANAQVVLRNSIHRRQTSSDMVGSEPLRRISPTVNPPKPGVEQGISPRSQSMPLQPKESTPQASASEQP
jgi:hypothetical protein